jgi:acyl-coenzyme A synthetase/AMP-(fatty) acid ligase
MNPSTLTLGDFFLNSCRQHPGQNFIRQADGEGICYEEALFRVARIVQAFDQMGLKKGDRVVCYWEETLPAIFFTIACALSGVIFIPLSPIFSVHYLKNLICQSGARGIFTTLDRLGQLEEAEMEPTCLSEGSLFPTPGSSLSFQSMPSLEFEEALGMLKERAASIFKMRQDST